MYFLGIDLGSSSVKLSILDAERGATLASVKVPEFEMEMKAPRYGWAEQEPEDWWEHVKTGIHRLNNERGIDLQLIKGIGIAYQMHGLVLTNDQLKPVRPSIIWCDSRAAEIGDEAAKALGKDICENQILGSPGNFTASKLKWVKDNEPEVYAKASIMMLPGDYIAAKLTGIAQISTSGLSEAALWDFSKGQLAKDVLEKMDLPESFIPEIVPSFGHQATISSEIAQELGFNKDVQINYRAGDQPNNAFSLNALKAGDIATTAGTSAVMYAVSSKNTFDSKSRVNTFLHVNNTAEAKHNGVLLCINGSGILYQWLRKMISLGQKELVSYELLNEEASKVEPGCEGLRFYPFGNGVERIFNNKEVNSGLENLNYNIHQPAHVIRSACEGIVFAMNYGFEVMQSIGVEGKIVRAGKDNLFLSPVFREIFVNTTKTTLELYNTSGSEGAARGAAVGFGYYKEMDKAFQSLECIERLEPNQELSNKYQEIYKDWKQNIKIKA